MPASKALKKEKIIQSNKSNLGKEKNVWLFRPCSGKILDLMMFIEKIK